MKIRYDPDADAMYITLKEGNVHHTKEIDKNIIVDFDKDGEVLGIELLFVKEKNPNLLKQFQVENLVQA